MSFFQTFKQRDILMVTLTPTGLGIVSISLAMAALVNLPIKEPAPVMATAAA